MRTIRKFLIPAVAVMLTWCAANTHWGNNHWKHIIASDGKGYYSYLPAIFIYDDLNLGFFEEIENKYYDKNTRYDYRSGYNGKVIDKYFAGAAVAMSPFFFAAHLITKFSEKPADGYSKYYAIFVNIAGIFYLLAGLHYLRKTLLLYSIREIVSSVVLVAIVFGTNVFYYTVSEPAMSHIYSFAFVSMFVYYAKKYFLTVGWKYIFMCCLLLGMIMLIRPVNGIIILALPFIAGNFDTLCSGFLHLVRNKCTFLLSMLGWLFIISIQLIIYKIETGDFVVDTYGEEHFTWGSPHMVDILFSYKKGLFLYTPLILLAVAGIFILFRKNNFEFYSFVLFFLALTYVLSCWHQWWYGGSFGLRAYIEFFPVFAIPLALSIQAMRKKIAKSFYITVIFLLVAICQVQTYQYRYYHIHWSEMTSERYWKVFLRLDLLIKNKNPNKDLISQ